LLNSLFLGELVEMLPNQVGVIIVVLVVDGEMITLDEVVPISPIINSLPYQIAVKRL